MSAVTSATSWGYRCPKFAAVYLRPCRQKTTAPCRCLTTHLYSITPHMTRSLMPNENRVLVIEDCSYPHLARSIVVFATPSHANTQSSDGHSSIGYQRPIDMLHILGIVERSRFRTQDGSLEAIRQTVLTRSDNSSRRDSIVNILYIEIRFK